MMGLKELRQAVVIVDVDYPGVMIPDRLRQCVQGSKLTIDLTTQAPRLRVDPERRWFQFGRALSLGHIPAGAVIVAMDRATGAVWAAEKVH